MNVELEVVVDRTERCRDGLEKLGSVLKAKLEDRLSMRYPLETQWLQNLRQYRAIYDPDVLKNIPEGRSRSYPKDTRAKIKGFVAKMMEMMFPATELNWELTLSDIPSVPEQDVQDLILVLQQQAEAQAIAEAQEAMAQGADPASISIDPAPVDTRDIEKAVYRLANVRRGNMQKKIQDQLADREVNWPSLCKRVIRSGAIYGIGIAKAPLVRKQKERTWEPDASGVYMPVVTEEHRPYPEFVKVWDIYPDLTSHTWDDQDGLFERIVLSRHAFSELKKRPGFMSCAIDTYLRDNATGNYIARTFESDLDSMNVSSSTTVNEKRRGRFEVFRWFGFCNAHELVAAGVDVPEQQMGMEILADVWMIDNTIIYADTAPFGNKVSDVYHAYIYAEDEEAGLTGVGMPVELRDRQMSICANTRALYDNMAASAGPMYEIAKNVLSPTTGKTQLGAFTVIERDGEGSELAYPAVRSITTDSHVGEFLRVLESERQMFDLESNLPSWMLGNAQPLGEAFRTTSNMSQMTGGANMVTKDHVRSFDQFTSSVIGALLQWNMDFMDDPELKGDYQVRAKGNLSLVAKEVRAMALQQFAQTLSPEQRAHINDRYVLEELARGRDLLVEKLFVTEEEAAAKIAAMQASASKQADAESALVEAKTSKVQADAGKVQVLTQEKVARLQGEIELLMAKVEDMRANAKTKNDKQQLDIIERQANLMQQQVKGAMADELRFGQPTEELGAFEGET